MAGAIWVLCPGGGECDEAISPGCPPPLCLLLSRRLTVMWSEGWGPDWQMSWLKTNCPLCFWLFWGCAETWLSNMCVGERPWCDCCWYETTNAGRMVFLSVLLLARLLYKNQVIFPLKMWPFLFIEGLTCSCSKIYQYVAWDFILHSHRSVYPINTPVPEYWSLSTNEIVHRQRFQSIRER